MNSFPKLFLSCGLCLSIVLAALAEDPAEKGDAKSGPTAQETRAAMQEALAELNPLVGGWRGVGQPVRNSNKGSWSESAEWVWEIKKEHVGIRYMVKDGKHLVSALVTWDPQMNDFILTATLPDTGSQLLTLAREHDRVRSGENGGE
jgi:hypothetical protein